MNDKTYSKFYFEVYPMFAKKYPGYKGVCIIDIDEKRFKALKKTDIADVWGIGRQYAKKLRAININTAYDFAQLPPTQQKLNL